MVQPTAITMGDECDLPRSKDVAAPAPEGEGSKGSDDGGPSHLESSARMIHHIDSDSLDYFDA